MNLTIRPATLADARDMAQVQSLSWEAAYRDILPENYIKEKNAARLALLRERLMEKIGESFVIQADGRMVGVLRTGSPQEEAVEIRNGCAAEPGWYELQCLYLHPDGWRRGIGKAAVSYALSRAREAGKTTLMLWVFAQNTSAIQFYQACGFKFDGAEKTYDCGKPVKCLRMKRSVS